MRGGYTIATIGGLGEPGNPANPYPSLEDLWRQSQGLPPFPPYGPPIVPPPIVPPSPPPPPAPARVSESWPGERVVLFLFGALAGGAACFVVLRR